MHQQVTIKWWRSARERLDLTTSNLVIQEAAWGDEDAARARLQAFEDVMLLEATQDAEYLAEELNLSACGSVRYGGRCHAHHHRSYEPRKLPGDLESPPHCECSRAIPSSAGLF